MFHLFHKTDQSLQQDVADELHWDPSLSAEDISVTAKEGVVTLRGSVPHYFEKRCAEKAAQRVGGVKAVADELEVELLGSYVRTDTDIAQTALNAFHWNYAVPDGVKVIVEKGWVTLQGTVDWAYERNAAQEAVGFLMGVRGVTNEITLKSQIQPKDVKHRIEEALKRTAEGESDAIGVSVDGDEVTLAGIAHSISEVEDATLAAWSAPGVTMVHNHMKIAS